MGLLSLINNLIRNFGLLSLDEHALLAAVLKIATAS